MSFNTIQHVIGFAFIWFCINYKRTDKIKVISLDWLLMFILTILAAFLFEYKIN